MSDIGICTCFTNKTDCVDSVVHIFSVLFAIYNDDDDTYSSFNVFL